MLVQLLECESVSHLTATSNLCFTSGRHCWQFVVAVPCDLVWLGLSDGSLQPDVWGGKQPGGWFYGSNDVSECRNFTRKGRWRHDERSGLTATIVYSCIGCCC